ncbi:hypothetical protein BsWGS_09623 [Bradybaena similaris]
MADVGRLSFVALCLGFVFLTYRDVISSQEPVTVQKDVKAPKLSSFAGPTLKFLFCYS